MNTPSDIFKNLSNGFLADLAHEVLSHEVGGSVDGRVVQKQAVEMIIDATGVKDVRTAERLVTNCTRNEVLARWVAEQRNKAPKNSR